MVPEKLRGKGSRAQQKRLAFDWLTDSSSTTRERQEAYALSCNSNESRLEKWWEDAVLP